MKIDKETLIRRQIEGLARLSLEDLKARFEELYGFTPATINSDSMRRRIAYRLQEIQIGGLSQEAEEYLDALVEDDPLAKLEAQKARKYTCTKGTRFIRDWNGVTYEVIVQGPSRFEFNGTIYKSLSAIAQAITGTHWNGKRFFGVSK